MKGARRKVGGNTASSKTSSKPRTSIPVCERSERRTTVNFMPLPLQQEPANFSMFLKSFFLASAPRCSAHHRSARVSPAKSLHNHRLPDHGIKTLAEADDPGIDLLGKPEIQHQHMIMLVEYYLVKRGD